MLKVGDKVKVKSLTGFDVNAGPKITIDMYKYKGKTFTIHQIEPYIRFKEDASWYWIEKWLEPIKDKYAPLIKRMING